MRTRRTCDNSLASTKLVDRYVLNQNRAENSRRRGSLGFLSLARIRAIVVYRASLLGLANHQPAPVTNWSPAGCAESESSKDQGHRPFPRSSCEFEWRTCAVADAAPSTRTSPGQTRRRSRISFMSSHRWRGTFVGEARTNDVIASRRLASDWLGDDITRWCVCLCVLELRKRKRVTRTGGGYSTILPPGPSVAAVPPIPPPSILLSLSLSFSFSLSLSHPSLSYPVCRILAISRRLGRSRGASFPPLSLPVPRDFPASLHVLPSCLLVPFSWKFFPSRFLARVCHVVSLILSPSHRIFATVSSLHFRLLRGSVSATSSLSPHSSSHLEIPPHLFTPI